MRMQKKNQLIIIAATILAFGASSCSKNIYDEDLHYKIIKYVSPVDSVDQKHTWQLTNYYTYSVTINGGVGAERLEFYTDNPVESTNAEMMARAFVKEGQQVVMSVSVPNMLTTIYAALVDSYGKYTVTSFSPTVRNIDFSEPIAVKQNPVLANPKIMAYTYCYEENFPEPGDYDFNDVVMRISLERTSQKSLTIDVTLAAVGADKILAGALRLVGYRYEDIDSVVAVGGNPFNKDVPKTAYELIESDDVLQKGKNKEAVINLFMDAHWAMGDDIETVNDEFVHKKYNVMRTYSDVYEVTYAKTASFTVYFKNESSLNSFTQEMIDPFLITYYAGARLEIHLDEFKDAQVFYNYNTIKFKDIPWALKIPTRHFLYPMEGYSIGFRKRLEDGSTGMFGAYMTAGHSFGEWVEDRNSCLDWYEYPTSNQVYQ